MMLSVPKIDLHVLESAAKVFRRARDVSVFKELSIVVGTED